MVKAGGGNRGLCTNCEKETEFEYIEKSETFKVKGQPVTVKVKYSKCKNCGDEVYDPALQDPFDLAYREYRRKHSLLQPEEIMKWRKLHRLTQKEVSRLLGTGVTTINRYENGALQNEAHDRLLRLAMDPACLMKIVEQSEGVFSKERKTAILGALRKADDSGCSVDNTIMINFGGAQANQFNGNRKLDLVKLYNAVLFLTRDGVIKTKLNKLLFYADFRHYKEYKVSLTGLQYAHLPYGPVPDNYDMYYAALSARGMTETIEEIYPNGYAGEIIKARKAPDMNVFSPGELRILASVAEDFKELNAAQIRDLSHREVGYQKTNAGDFISYDYAKKLRG